MRRALLISLSALLVTAAAGAAIAADMPVKARPARAPVATSDWLFEIGGRYWYSSATNRYNYYADGTTANRVSRLSYDGLSAHTGEAFFRLDSPYRIFVKGYAGAGNITRGTLYDEDYPPGVVPYSKTESDAKGFLDYVSGDLGYTLFDGRGAQNRPAMRVGAFAGVHYWREKATGYGCDQIGGGNICDAGNQIPKSIAVISEEDKWTALRLGAVADFYLTRDLKLTVDAAYARVHQNAVDTHLFTLGTTPSSGNGHGFELESLVSYQLTRSFNIGIGGRWWHYETKLNDNNGQLLEYKTDRFGAFVQGSMKFGGDSRAFD
jgi:hypothetical protein